MKYSGINSLRVDQRNISFKKTFSKQELTSSLVVRLQADKKVWNPAKPMTDQSEKNAITASTIVATVKESIHYSDNINSINNF